MSVSALSTTKEEEMKNMYIYKTVVCSHFIGRVRIPAPSSDMPLARRVPEIRHDRSLRSSNRRFRDRRNHGLPQSKPNPASQKSTTLTLHGLSAAGEKLHAKAITCTYTWMQFFSSGGKSAFKVRCKPQYSHHRVRSFIIR